MAWTGRKDVAPDRQLVWQVFVSALIFMIAAPFFCCFISDVQPIHLWGLAFQLVVIVTFAFAFAFALWLWLMSVYPLAIVAAFSFRSPVFGVFFGWLFLDEALGLPVLVALVLVSASLILISRPVQVPQKV